jgi:tetratricopeptide (TPR) repeat protein
MTKSNSKAGAKSTARPAPIAPEKSPQQKAFDTAMELFHAREFSKAKQHFSAALEGNSKELQFAAKQHLLMCEKRLSKANVKLETAEDYYNYGIGLYNRRDLEAAQQHLEKALKLEEADHVHYALALVLGLRSDIEGAVKHLSRAIALQSRNRNSALNDPDFQELLQHAPIKELLAGAPAHS